MKNKLGKAYDHIFVSAPFAKRGGLTGTTERLRRWLATLAASVNEGKVSPDLVTSLAKTEAYDKYLP